MAGDSNIEWTDATWNPVRGCSRITTGCGGPNHEGGCYAEKIAARFSDPGQPFHGFAERTPYGGRWTGKLALIDDTLAVPLRWKKPRKIFVNSMSDLFHEALPDEAIDRVFAVMALCPQHTFQVLTKRAERMRQWFAVDRADSVGLAMLTIVDRIPYGHRRVPWPLPNVWLGISCERQQEADERIPHLLQTPAAIRFVSAEPLLAAIDFQTPGYTGFLRDGSTAPWQPKLDWVIVGGESGSKARPMHPDWARKIRDDCAAAGVAFFFKQWGEYLPVGQSLPGCGKVHGATAVKLGRMKLHYGGTPQHTPKHAFAERGVEFASTADGRLTFRVGKKSAGRLLDGKEHNAFPVIDSSALQSGLSSPENKTAEAAHS